MQVRHRFLAGPTPDVRVDRATLDRPGTDQGHLDDQVVEASGQQPWQRAHLGAGLHLEHPDGVRTAELVVDALLFLRDGVHVPPLPAVVRRQVERVLQRGEHAEPEHVELHEPHVGAVVLVPLQDGPAVHPGVLDRHDLAHRPVGQDHAARVDAEVPREPEHLLGQVDHGLRDVVVLALGDRAPPLDLLRPGVLLPGAVAECLRHVPHGTLRPVGDDVGDLCGVEPAVLVVDVLDHLFTPVGVEVHVDVGFLVAHRRQEPFERQAVPDRVDGGDLEQEADRRVCRRPAPLAEDPPAAGELHHVADDEEVPGEALVLDDGQFAFDALPFVRVDPVGVTRVEPAGPTPGEVAQPAHRGVPVRHVEVGQTGLRRPQCEPELVGEFHASLDRTRPPREPPRHLGTGAQVRGVGGGQPPVDLVETAAGPDRGEGGRDREPVRGGVVDVAGRHDGQRVPVGQEGEDVVPGAVERVAVIRQLDHHVAGAEPVQQRAEGLLGRALTAAFEGLADAALPTAGEHPPPPARAFRQVVEVVPRPTLLGPRGEVRRGHRAGHPVVPVLPVGQQQQVRALGVGDAVLRLGEPERQFGAVDGGDARVRLGDLGHPGGPVEAVVVGDRQSVQAQACCLFQQVLRRARAVQEAEGRVRVEFGVRDGRRCVRGREVRRPVRCALPGPGRAVTAVALGGRAGAALVREGALELRPRDRRVVVPHQEPSFTSRSPLPTSGGRRGPGTRPARRRPRAAAGAVVARRTPTSARRAARDRPRP